MNYKEKHCTTTAHCCAALTGDFVFKNNVQQAMVAFWYFVPWMKEHDGLKDDFNYKIASNIWDQDLEYLCDVSSLW